MEQVIKALSRLNKQGWNLDWHCDWDDWNSDWAGKLDDWNGNYWGCDWYNS